MTHALSRIFSSVILNIIGINCCRDLYQIEKEKVLVELLQSMLIQLTLDAHMTHGKNIQDELHAIVSLNEFFIVLL